MDDDDMTKLRDYSIAGGIVIAVFILRMLAPVIWG